MWETCLPNAVDRERNFMKKGNNKKKKGKFANAVKLKPYTAKQQDAAFLGKVLFWGLLLSFVVIVFVGVKMSWGTGKTFLILGIVSLLFAIYNLIGLILKWDHQRVCAKWCLSKYEFDIRIPWSKEDKKDGITIAALWGGMGMLLLLGSFLTDIL